MLKERCKGTSIDFNSLMQVDFILYLKSCLEKEKHRQWWPETLLYSDRYQGAFEVFARSKSITYFDRAKILLGINKKVDLEKIIEPIRTGQARIPSWHFHSVSVEKLLGYAALATTP